MPEISQTIQETPAALVENGQIRTGFFRTPFREVRLLDADLMAGRAMRWLRLKEWVGFAFEHPQICGAMIIQDAKFAASATVYVYDRAAKRLYEWLVVAMPGTVRLPETLWQGVSHCSFGQNSVHFDHDLAHGRHTVQVDIAATRGMPALRADLLLHQDLATVDPLVVSLPIAPQHHTYTHKSPLRVQGALQIGEQSWDLDPARDFGGLDEQKTFYPYRSHWHWASFIGKTTAGRQLMVNLVDQMTPKGQPGEDALWLDGWLQLIDPVAFIADGPPGHFRLEDPEGRIRLRFTPDAAKVERRAWLVVAMDYAQHFGHFHGEVRDADGTTHHVDGIGGVLETMQARF